MGDNDVTQPKDGSKITESRREQTKAFGKNWIIGVAVLALFSILGHIGNMFGITALNISTISSPSDLVNAMVQLTPAQALFMLFSVAGIGAVTFLLVSSQIGVGKLVRLHRDTIIDDHQLNEEVRRSIKKMRIIPLFVWMGLVALVVVPTTAGISTVHDVVLSNVHGKLTDLAVSYIATAITVAIGGAVTGWLMIRLRKWYFEIYDKIEPYIQKGRVF